MPLHIVARRFASTAAPFLPRDVVIVSSARTPIGSFQGKLASLSATRLGAISFKAAVQRAGLTPQDIEEVYMGNVIAAGAGQAPARQVALEAGCPVTTEATTINKVCASGMKAVMMATQSIALGHREVMVAGGMESMSNVPYIVRSARAGAGYGHQTMEDLVLGDGLTDVYNKVHMGMCGEETAQKYSVGRPQQDQYALESYRRSAEATKAGRFKSEIVSVEVPQKKGAPLVLSEDEEYVNVNPDKVPSLRAVFKKDGTITAANASTLNDGACSVVLMSAAAAAQRGIKPLARILAFADAAIAPIDFPTAPAHAVPRALQAAGLTVDDVALWEINEAFSVVVLANMKILGLDHKKVNVNGGAVSLGHPIGMSGARITATLAHQLQPGQKGVAAICNGGGGASAIVVEKL